MAQERRVEKRRRAGARAIGRAANFPRGKSTRGKAPAADTGPEPGTKSPSDTDSAPGKEKRGKSGGRPDGRGPRALRPVRITPGYIRHAEGSALIEVGHTKVICTASVEEGVPRFLRDSGRGWVTAEYGMLPRSTNTRSEREAARGRIGGRTSEIQRLIGRVLRSVLDFERLGERTVRIDCDVLQADGGTRTASITGGFVALAQAFDGLVRSAALRQSPIREAVAAVSVGIVGGRAVVDLDYAEDSQAEVDMNVAMTASGRFVEVQGTAEHAPFTQTQLDRMTALAAESMRSLFAAQRAALAEIGAILPGAR